ncbi:serine/threonine-protein kinase [Acaryochloris sp. IP29b_bin.137]|uniref:serine/threonine protein kinase n=1 Tax=Acaryochloris sp. IP29b_bin.137 TaxID=2969217 RepID=UPI00262737C2|nr:serine/threonine-protein kinase [Acaryochloris sp. IP29b_bin.137]
MSHSTPKFVYCPNPKCKERRNEASVEVCPGCQSPLVLNHTYQLVQPLVNLDHFGNTEIFDVVDKRWAEHPQMGRKVMKILKYNGGYLERLFRREALHLQNLNHPGIPQVYPEDRSDRGYFSISIPHRRRKIYYFLMEKIEGQNLHHWINQNGPIDEATLLPWLRELLKIVAYLHANKIWHRDIKPSNIMLRPNGQLVLIDFGAVKQVRPRSRGKGDPPTGPHTTVTNDGIFAAGYTPPEQIRGRTVQQSDLYALGRTCVHLLTRIPPYDLEEDDAGKLIWRDQAPGVSSVLADWVDHLMAPFVQDRPQSATKVLEYIHTGKIDPLPQSRSEEKATGTQKSQTEEATTVSPENSLFLWGWFLNLILFSVLLVSGLLWWQARENSQPVEEPNQQVRQYP